MKKAQYISIIGLLLISCIVNASEIKINSLKELASYASKSGNVIRMVPGVYKLTDYIPIDSIIKRRERKEFQFITFSGNDNVFHLDGVEILFNNELREALNPPIHSSEFLISGRNNTLSGLTIRYEREGNSRGGAALEVGGEENTRVYKKLGRTCLFFLSYLNKQNEWVDIMPEEDELVVNVGDMLQRLTNDYLKSTTHRVVNPPRALWHQPRLSIPFFLHPKGSMDLTCLEQCVTASSPLQYEPITAGEYLDERLREIGLKK